MSTLTMKPMQIHFRPAHVETARAVASRRGVSFAELVRQALDNFLVETPVEEDPLWNIIGTFDSGLGNLAEKHDEYIVRFIHEENHP